MRRHNVMPNSSCTYTTGGGGHKGLKTCVAQHRDTSIKWTVPTATATMARQWRQWRRRRRTNWQSIRLEDPCTDPKDDDEDEHLHSYVFSLGQKSFVPGATTISYGPPLGYYIFCLLLSRAQTCIFFFFFTFYIILYTLLTVPLVHHLCTI